MMGFLCVVCMFCLVFVLVVCGLLWVVLLVCVVVDVV